MLFSVELLIHPRGRARPACSVELLIDPLEQLQQGPARGVNPAASASSKHGGLLQIQPAEMHEQEHDARASAVLTRSAAHEHVPVLVPAGDPVHHAGRIQRAAACNVVAAVREPAGVAIRKAVRAIQNASYSSKRSTSRTASQSDT